MVIPRKWKFVAGSMSAAVALGASAAVAQEGGDETLPDNQPVLTEVVDIEKLPKLDVANDTVVPLLQVQDEGDVDSPFDSVPDESDSVESESLPSEESVSIESEESASIESEESASLDSESLPSEESVSPDSVD